MAPNRIVMHAGTQHDQPFLAPPISSDIHVAGFLASISDGCTKTKSPVDRAIDGISNCRFQKFEYLFRVLGCDLALPLILAPIGYSSLMHSRGEIAAARAAGDSGTAYILSTISGVALEDVKAATFGPLFYQLYLIGGRKVAEFTIERARNAGFSG